MSASIAIEPAVEGHPQAALLRANAAGAPQPWAGQMLESANELDRLFLIMQAGMPPLQLPIDNLATALPALASLFGPDDPPPVETSSASALAHFSHDRQKYYLWSVWRRATVLIASWDTWRQELFPQPKGGRSMS